MCIVILCVILRLDPKYTKKQRYATGSACTCSTLTIAPSRPSCSHIVSTTPEQRESPLSVAVSRDDIAMVRFLMTLEGLKVSDCILQASQMGLLTAVTELLDFIHWREGLEGESAGCAHSDRFPSYATPLTLAAIAGHFGLVQFLVQRGHKIDFPHASSCKCTACW